MEDIGELQDLVKDQLMRHAQTKYKPSLFSATTSSSSLKFSDASSSSVATQLQPQTLTQPSSLLLNFEPSKEYQRSSRVIKHTGDRYVVGTDYTDLQSLGSQSKSFARTAKPKFPEYSSLSSRASSSYMKGQSRGKLRKVTLTKLESLTRSYESKSSNRGVIADNDSLSLSLSSMKSNSLDELFAAKFMEREETKKELDAERFFTSKVQTPRLVQEDSEARFKSKDLLNSMIEDVSQMSMSTMCTKGQSLGSGSLGTLNEWKTMYEAENINYDSAALFAEVRYLELKTLEREGGSRPSKLKATVCADLLLKLCASAGRISRVMEPILWELLNCVFIDFPNQEHKLRGAEPLKALYSMPTYFDKHKEQMEIYDDVHNELEMVQQGLKMSEIVKKFQTVKMVFKAGNFFQRDCSFFLWKGEVNKSKQRQRVALRRALLYRWRQWRAYLSQYGASELEDMDSELDKKIESLGRLQMLLQGFASGSSDSPVPTPTHSDALHQSHAQAQQAQSRPISRAAPPGGIALDSVAERDEDDNTTGATATATSADISSRSLAPAAAVSAVTALEDKEEEEEDTIGFEPDVPAPMIGTPPLASVRSAKSGSFRRSAAVASVQAPPSVGAGVASPDLRIRGSEKVLTDQQQQQQSEKRFKRERGCLPVVVQASPEEQRRAQEQKLAERRNMMEQVDSSIRTTLSSLSVSSFKGGSKEFASSRSMGVSNPATPMASASFSTDHHQQHQQHPQYIRPNLTVELSGFSASTDGFSSRTPMGGGTGTGTVDLLKEAALLASTFTCPSKDQTTQTPDVWMTNVNEQPFANALPMALLNRNSSIRPGMGSLSRQNSGIRMNGSPGMAMASGKHLAAKEKEKEEGHIDVGGKNPPAYKLESIQACQLIAYIYECKLKEALEDHNEINFYECEPLLEFAKEKMLKRYGLKRLADKFFKGLILCVIKEGNVNRRLETFGQLCGLTLEGHKEGKGFSEGACSFYFRALGIIFGANTHLLSECMNAFEIDREIILEVLPDLFPHIEKHDPELSKTIMFEVVDLPRNTPGNELEYKVNFDDLMVLIMDYYEEHERKLDVEESFLDIPLVEPVVQEVSVVVRPQSPAEQLQALSALTNFSKKLNTNSAIAQTPKRVRVMQTQDLV